MDDQTLARDLTELVLAVDGVSAVYPSAPLVVASVASVVGVSATRPAISSSAGTELSDLSDSGSAAVRGVGARQGVEVSTDANTVRSIDVIIGVADDQAATDTCRAVHDRIADYLALAGERGPSSISVKVGRIG